MENNCTGLHCEVMLLLYPGTPRYRLECGLCEHCGGSDATCVRIWPDQTEVWVDYSLVDIVLHIM